MKKFKIILIVISLALITYAGYKYKTTNPYKLSALEPNHYLYLIEDSDGNGMYLVGSMHSGTVPMKIDGKLLEAYNDSGTIAFEMRWDNFDQETYHEIMKLNPASEIDDPEFFEFFEELDDKYNYINKDALQYNISMIYSLAIGEISKNMGLTEIYGVDMTILNHSIEDDKTILEMESLELRNDQARDMTEYMPINLIYGLLYEDIIINNILNQAISYRDGSYLMNLDADIAFMYDETLEIPSDFYNSKEEKKKWETYRKSIIFHRNDYMYAKAIEYIKLDDVLTIVGIDHLHGAHGLLTQFEENGYTVTKQ